jgi:hypothetical protein
MAIRTLRRKVIIREYDYEKVRDQSFMPLRSMGLMETMYDRAEFRPITKTQLEYDNLIMLLRDDFEENPLRPTAIPALFLFNAKDYLYNQKYIEWKSEYDDDGYIWIQAKKNAPRTRLGWGIFEKDLVSRL